MIYYSKHIIHIITQDEKKGYLKLSLALGLLKDRLHLGSLHDVALDLELAAHEQTLGVGLAGNQALEVAVGEVQGDYPILAHIYISPVHRTHHQPCRPREQHPCRQHRCP